MTDARALGRAPALLVVDELSSALDVETEELLWERIAGGGPGTLLVVSHRQDDQIAKGADAVQERYGGGQGEQQPEEHATQELERGWPGEVAD